MTLAVSSDIPQNLGARWYWDKQRNQAAVLLAIGESKVKVAEEIGIDRSTLYYWLSIEEFAEEVDRLSLMVGVASRAERLRMVNRAVKQLTREDGSLITEKDVLDWLKFAQSETTGAKIDLSKLTEMLTSEVEQPSQPQLSSSSDAIDVTPEIQASDSDLAPQPVVPTGDDEHNR